MKSSLTRSTAKIKKHPYYKKVAPRFKALSATFWGGATSFLSRFEAPSSAEHLRLRLLGIGLERQRRWVDAEEVYRGAAHRFPDAAHYHDRLARLFRRRKNRWLEIESLEAAVAAKPTSPWLWHRLGRAREAMQHYEQAAHAFSSAAAIRPRRSQWHYRHGLAWERAGNDNNAREAYARAIAADRKLDSARFGIGVFHERIGLWGDAVRAFRDAVSARPADAELVHRLARALDRCHEYAESASAYEQALALDPSQTQWAGRLGSMREGLERWSSAADAYGLAASTLRGPHYFWRYRQGYCLAQIGRYEDACEAFLLSHPETDLPALTGDERSIAELVAHLTQDTTDPDVFRQLAEAHERRGEWELAAESYWHALARFPTHQPTLCYRRGVTLFGAGRLADAVEAFLDTRQLRRPIGVSDNVLRSDRGLRRVVHYTEHIETLHVRDRTVLYESFHGRSMACNPLAIFRSIVEDPRFADWVHIWPINDVNVVPSEYLSRRNVIFIKRECDTYMRHLATAKYLINNTSFSSYFIRRSDQLYLNTWHGTPLKTLGRDVSNDFIGWRNIARNFLHCTHIISGNEHTSNVLLESFEVGGVFPGVLAETGYPRVDATLSMGAEERRELRRRLGVADGAPVVLYAPTFRGSVGNVEDDIESVRQDVAAIRSAGCHVLYRGHYFGSYDDACDTVVSAIPPSTVDTNDLLAITDVLVSDYSSVVIDFLPTRRPIVHYIYDFEEYKRDRGLYIDREDLPGMLCESRSSLASVVATALECDVDDVAPKYERAVSAYCAVEDGHSADRVVDFFFYDKTGGGTVVRRRSSTRSVIFYAGLFSANGITASFTSLAKQLEHDVDLEAVVIVEPDGVRKQPERIELLSRLGRRVRIFGRNGRMNVTLDERHAIQHQSAHNDLPSRPLWSIYERAFRREARRLFGESAFDCAVNFDGYGHFWPSLMGNIGAERHVMYQHNDMRGEHELKFPSLAGTFRIYRYYDSLVSVSRRTRDLNLEKLAHTYDFPMPEHRFCDNAIDAAEIINRSREDLSEDPVASVFSGGDFVFLAIGRLSPEKGHERLIHAFSRILSTHPNARLLILGEGPSRGVLEDLVKGLGLSERVALPGLRPNPFPFLRRADLFVLPSHHEGQGLVLLEAMVLGVPIVCTDFPPAHDVLGDSYGEIVENSEEGLVRGMTNALEGRARAGDFDHAAYIDEAVKGFYRNVLGWERGGRPASND
ncbi:MAG: CDP-glycerol glycerophosphotransferase family protein [Sandaracinaceae bacterium]|nr:CDP-glycerol glycerophosphotransferase family protein [Sandaracinaceae bacterium]